MATEITRLRSATADGEISGPALKAALDGEASLPDTLEVLEFEEDEVDKLRITFAADLDAAQEATVDTIVGAHDGEKLEAEFLLRRKIHGPDPLAGYTVSTVVSGLSVTTTIDPLVVDDVTTITADPSETKYLLILYVFDESLDAFTINAYEKTTGLYADLDDDEVLVAEIGEWSVVANGSELVEV